MAHIPEEMLAQKECLKGLEKVPEELIAQKVFLEEIVHSMVKLDQVSTLFNSFIYAQDLKFENMSKMIDEMVERRLNRK